MWPSELECQTEPPADADDIIEFVDTVFAPLSDSEIGDLVREHKKIVGDGHFDPPFDPSVWRLPKHKLPDSYLEFLRFSNGGFFGGLYRDLDPLFTTRQVREHMLAYSIPDWMPESCPIGFDGGGTFYCSTCEKNQTPTTLPYYSHMPGILGTKMLNKSPAHLLNLWSQSLANRDITMRSNEVAELLRPYININHGDSIIANVRCVWIPTGFPRGIDVEASR